MTKKPFVEAVMELLRREGISQRELARRCKRHGWGSTSTVNFILTGDMNASVKAMTAIAQALAVPPHYFAEYRLAEARRRLDPQAVGLEVALRELGEE